MKMEEKIQSSITRSKIPQKVQQIIDSAENSLNKIKNEINSGEDLLFKGKFYSLGTRWNCLEDGDLGEQIQQSMTMLISYYAIDFLCDLLQLEENTSFKINAADANGPDISFEYKHENKKSIVYVEVFASKNPYNNNKLFHDLNVLATRSINTNNDDYDIMRFIVFCSPSHLKNRSKCNNEGIEITSSSLIDETSTDIKIEYRINQGNESINDKLSARIIRIDCVELCTWTQKILSKVIPRIPSPI